MIKRAQAGDLQAARSILAKIYDSSFVAFYLDNIYEPNNTYLLRDHDSITGMAIVNRYPLWLNNQKIRVSCLSTIYGRSDDGGSRIPAVLLDELLDELAHGDLITIVKSNLLPHYEGFGFEDIYRQRTYVLNRTQVPAYPDIGIVSDVSIGDMTEVYQRFTSYFDGYVHRSAAYYHNKLKWIASCGYRLIGYYDKHGILNGYMIYDPSSDPLTVKEIIYVNSVAFLKLINYVLGLKHSVRLSLSKNEDLTAIIPTAIYNDHDHMLGRLNDSELFNRLYNSNVASAAEAFRLSGKPLFINEYY